MRLKDPALIDMVISQLRSMELEVMNGMSNQQGRHITEVASFYMGWVDSTYGQLRSYLVDDGLAEGLHTQRYWEIVRSGGGLPRPQEVIQREVTTQVERLQAVRERLTALKEFIGRDGHIVVPDTSVFTRGVWFEDFDWVGKMGLKPAVRLVIPILVIEELDGLKDRERTSKAGDRARRILRLLRDLFAASKPSVPVALPKRPNVTVEVLMDDAWHRRHPIKDAEIIEQALGLKDLVPGDVWLVCVDAAMEFRAREHGLAAFAMPTLDEVPMGDRPRT
jgi:PIN domain